MVCRRGTSVRGASEVDASSQAGDEPFLTFVPGNRDCGWRIQEVWR